MPNCIFQRCYGPILIKNILKKQLQATKNENVDLEKQVNNSTARSFFSTSIASLFFMMLLFCGFLAKAQSSDFVAGQEYIIDSIQVVGLKSFNKKTVISYSGLRKGQKVRLPGDQISSVINKLWNLDLFSDINFYAVNVKEKSLTI